MFIAVESLSVALYLRNLNCTGDWVGLVAICSTYEQCGFVHIARGVDN